MKTINDKGGNTLFNGGWFKVVSSKYCNEHRTLLKTDGTCELCQEEFINQK